LAILIHTPSDMAWFSSSHSSHSTREGKEIDLSSVMLMPAAAQEFYGKTLGLKTSEEYGLLTLHIAGDRDTLVYEKPDQHQRRPGP
jgi:hypothetical protein